MRRKRYSWFFFDPNRDWQTSLILTIILVGIAIVVFMVYNNVSMDLAPDSIAGYSYAIMGTLCMLLATIGYTRARHSRKRGIGTLNKALNWHVSFGILALVLLFLHSFGNFNPRSGTYALYGMIALIISGVVGRMLDRFLPRLIAYEANRTMNRRGDDRMLSIVQNTRKLAALRSLQQPGNESLWPPAAYKQRSQVAEVTSQLLSKQQQQVDEINTVQRIFYREQFYRAAIRYWRVFHVSLVLLTIGLTLWHLVYAAQLLYPVFFGTG